MTICKIAICALLCYRIITESAIKSKGESYSPRTYTMLLVDNMSCVYSLHIVHYKYTKRLISKLCTKSTTTKSEYNLYMCVCSECLQCYNGVTSGYSSSFNSEDATIETDCASCTKILFEGGMLTVEVSQHWVSQFLA